MKKPLKILVLSFYFRPDLSAGSFRTTALVDALQNRLPAAGEIEVITTQPNRYSTFVVDAAAQESSPNLSIIRIALPAHRNGMRDQAKAFICYAREVLRHTRGKHYDLVYATSSRLMTAVLGAWVARQDKAPLYLDIRDIFVDTIQDVLPRYLAVLTKPFFTGLERWAVQSAAHVNLVSQGFQDYFAQRYPSQRFSFFTNGIDDEFLQLGTPTETTVSQNVVEVLYAGNIGEGQGLHTIIPALAQKMGARVRFKIIGDGGRLEALRLALAHAGVTNVELLAPMPRAALIAAYQAADVLFLHLNDYPAFKKVLPSKLFEYGAMGKPIWAGVAGYAAQFVQTELDNAAVFEPCDAAQAQQVFASLRLQTSPRHRFVSQYARSQIAQDMAEDILKISVCQQ